MRISEDIYYVGVNDHEIDLFEGQYQVPLGMAYNSYLILDEKVAVIDTVDIRFGEEWLQNIEKVLSGRKPQYLIIQHMEPDHSANIVNFLKKYPEAEVVSNKKAFAMMDQFFGIDAVQNRVEVGNNGTLVLGRHTLTFVFAPMVHWPEVMVTYDAADKVLFSADGFGKFGANDVTDPEGWVPEARRYYIGIVGKYGPQVQALLKKAAALDIHTIAATHGPILTIDRDFMSTQDDTQGVLMTDDLGLYLDLYDKWSSYTPEDEGITIAYTSVYGNTRAAVMKLVEMLKDKGVTKLNVFDLARSDLSKALASAFQYSKLVLATTTYNAGIFPFMHTFIDTLVEHGYKNRKVYLIENGTWAPTAKSAMSQLLSKNTLEIAEQAVTIKSALNNESSEALEAMAKELSGI